MKNESQITRENRTEPRNIDSPAEHAEARTTMRGNPLKQIGKTPAALMKLTRAHAKQQGLILSPTAQKPFVTAADTDRETAFADIVADVMHLCDQQRVDPQEVLRRAKNHYDAETALECGQGCGASYSADEAPEKCFYCQGEVNPTCRGCGRQEEVCSANPCEGVLRDRAE